MTADRATLLALAERAEKATGPDQPILIPCRTCSGRGRPFVGYNGCRPIFWRCSKCEGTGFAGMASKSSRHPIVAASLRAMAAAQEAHDGQ